MLLPMLALAAGCISVEVNRAPAPSKISLSDRKAIMDLISSYGHTWDNKDAKGWTGLFTEGPSGFTVREANLKIQSTRELPA